MTKATYRILVASLVILTPLIGCQNKQFNVSDKSFVKNGNFPLAVSKLANTPPTQIWQGAKDMTAAEITKSPYSALGKLYRLTGSVFKIEEYPPKPGLTGNWGEVMLMAENPNSVFGQTQINFIYNGNLEKLNANTSITCAGYFVGIFESKNAFGGSVESIVIVGNSFKNK